MLTDDRSIARGACGIRDRGVTSWVSASCWL